MFLKFKAYPQNKSLYTNEAGDHLLEGQRDVTLLECDEVRHRNWWVSNGGDLQAILENEVGSWSPVWELPIRESNVRFPGDGLSLTRLIVIRHEPYTVETVFAYDCEIFVMSNDGKTIDRI